VFLSAFAGVSMYLQAITTDVAPTVGYSSVNFSFDGYDVTLYDLGGGPSIRGIWHNYYAECYGFVFVVDASNEARMDECLQVIMTFLDNKLVQRKPLLLWVPCFIFSVGHIWDVMLVWRKGNINENCLCVTVLCTIIMVHKDTSSSYRLVDCIGLWSCLV